MRTLIPLDLTRGQGRMSTFLINTVTVGATKVFAGDLIDDAVDDVVSIRARVGRVISR